MTPPDPRNARWEDYFEPGEELLWEGAPTGRFHMTPSLIFVALFGLPFLAGGVLMLTAGFAALLGFAEGDAWAGGFLVPFSLPFLAAGLLMVFGPWIAARMAPDRIRYALSDKRAYVAKRWFNRSLETYVISPDSAVELETGKIDNVYFHVFKRLDSDGDKLTEKIGFENISDAKKVYDLIRDLQRGAV